MTVRNALDAVFAETVIAVSNFNRHHGEAKGMLGKYRTTAVLRAMLAGGIPAFRERKQRPSQPIVVGMFCRLISLDFPSHELRQSPNSNRLVKRPRQCHCDGCGSYVPKSNPAIVTVNRQSRPNCSVICKSHDKKVLQNAAIQSAANITALGLIRKNRDGHRWDRAEKPTDHTAEHGNYFQSLIFRMGFGYLR
jgi:hypothetical protein